MSDKKDIFPIGSKVFIVYGYDLGEGIVQDPKTCTEPVGENGRYIHFFSGNVLLMHGDVIGLSVLHETKFSAFKHCMKNLKAANQKRIDHLNKAHKIEAEKLIALERINKIRK
jgi:hypothetical protein